MADPRDELTAELEREQGTMRRQELIRQIWQITQELTRLSDEAVGRTDAEVAAQSPGPVAAPVVVSPPALERTAVSS